MHVLACMGNLLLKTVLKDVAVESVCIPYMVIGGVSLGVCPHMVICILKFAAKVLSQV